MSHLVLPQWLPHLRPPSGSARDGLWPDGSFGGEKTWWCQPSAGSWRPSTIKPSLCYGVFRVSMRSPISSPSFPPSVYSLPLHCRFPFRRPSLFVRTPLLRIRTAPWRDWAYEGQEGPESKEKRRQRRRGGFAGGKRALATSPQRKSAAMIDRDGRWKFLFAGVFGMRAESTRGV